MYVQTDMFMYKEEFLSLTEFGHLQGLFENMAGSINLMTATLKYSKWWRSQKFQIDLHIYAKNNDVTILFTLVCVKMCQSTLHTSKVLTKSVELLMLVRTTKSR